MTGRARWLVMPLLAVLPLLAGCGLSEQGEPQVIASENLPPDLLDPNPLPSTTPSGGSALVSVYLIERVGDTERLAEVQRPAANAIAPAERIAALFSQPTEEETDAGLTTRIPPDTVLLDIFHDEDARELVVNLSNELFSIQGEELAKAFAQIVWTLSELDDVRQVRFLVDGVDRNALDAQGVEKEGPVTRADYAALAPPA